MERAGRPRVKRRLDSIDVEILRALSEDCSIGRDKLAEIVGVSVPTLRRRLRRLHRLGILGGCRAHVDVGRLGGLVALVRFSAEDPERVLESAGGLVERMYCSTGRGECVALVKALGVRGIEEAVKSIEEGGASITGTMILDYVLKEGSWHPREEAFIAYRCDFCGATIQGNPYIVDLGTRILMFTNKRCADAYFKLRGRPH